MPVPIDFGAYDLVHAVPYGVQMTKGRTVLYQVINNRMTAIVVLSEGECNRMLKVFWKGYAVPEFDAQGNRNWFFHSGKRSTGWGDPTQGRPYFFPTLDWTGNRVCYCEVQIPTDLFNPSSVSGAPPEPTDFMFLYECKLVMDYDAAGNELGMIYSPNNFLVAADMMRDYMRVPAFLKRNDWATWFACKQYAAEMIPWTQGKGLTGQYYNNSDYTNLRTTRIDPRIIFTWPDASPTIEVDPGSFSATWSGTITPQYTGVWTFYLNHTGAATLNINGVELVNRTNASQDASEVANTINLTAGQTYPVTLSLQHAATTQAVIEWQWSHANVSKSPVPQQRLGNAVINVPRFEANVVFPTPTDAFSAFYAALFLAAGCGWQEQNSKIEWYTAQPRNDSHLFIYRKEAGAPKTNVLDGFGAARIMMRYRPNLLRLHLRNKLDDVLKEARVYRMRDQLRDDVGGIIVDGGEIELGVCTPSHAQRTGEYQIRIQSDLSLFVDQPAWADSFHLQVGDIVSFAHIVPGWTQAGAPRFQIVEAEFRPSTSDPDTRTFRLQEWPLDGVVYDDTAHGPIVQHIVSEIPSPLSVPPNLLDLDLLVGPVVTDAVGHYTQPVDGLATFDNSYIYPQQGKVYLQLFQTGAYVYQNIIVPCDPVTYQGAFRLLGVPFGTHNVKVVTQNPSGASRSLAATTAYPITLYPPAPTLLKLFDNVAPQESHVDSLGLTVGVAKHGTTQESWYGCELFRDRGYGYERVGQLQNQVAMGHSVNGGAGWLTSAFNEVWVQLETGTFSNATLAEVNSGVNNYFVGREKIGVQFWQETPAGSGLWHGTGLVRGLEHTEIFLEHAAQEDVIQLDGNSYFLPCLEVRDLGQTLYFKAVTILQDIADAVAVPITIRCDSLRPFAVRNYEAFRDTSLDWLIHFEGQATPLQIPEWFVEIYSDATYTTLKRRLPVVIGTSNACSLVGTADGEYGVIKNNLYCGTDGPQYAVTVQSLVKTWTRFDFNLRWIGPDHTLIMPISFHEWITTAFLGALNRNPTPAEEADWTNTMTAAYPDHTALWNECNTRMTALFSSAEYVGPPTTDDDTFVNDCYQAFLMRNSEPAGHDFWLNETIKGGRAHVVDGFCKSLEFEHEIVDVLSPQEPASRHISVHLQTKNDQVPAAPDLNSCPISLSWEAAVMPGAVTERVLNYQTVIFTEAAFSDLRNQVDPGYALARNARVVSGRSGPRYTIFLAGTEYRVYADYVPNAGQKPLARCSAPTAGFPFPLRLMLAVQDLATGMLCVENVSIAGDLYPATVYAQDQQVLDFNAPQATIYVKIYQRGKYAGVDGFPIQFTAVG